MRKRAKRDVAVQFLLSFIAHRMVFRFYYHNSNKYHQLKKMFVKRKKTTIFQLRERQEYFSLFQNEFFIWIVIRSFCGSRGWD